MPGDNVEMVCSLVFDVALEVGTRFTLREGNKTSEYHLSLDEVLIDGFALSRNWYCDGDP
jgi:hypothetical protein